MEDLIKGLLYILVIAIVPVIAIGWLIYRLVKGSKGEDYSIK